MSLTTIPARYTICDVPVDAYTQQGLLDRFMELSAPGERGNYACYVNAHVHNLARQDHELRRILEHASVCYADGASVVWACRQHGLKIGPRLTAADFLPDFLRRFAAESRRVYLLGGKPGVAEEAVARLQETVPQFEPVGMQHGYFGDRDHARVFQEIRDARPDILIVGMGTPRQERWLDRNRESLDIPLIWAVGALLDYCAGEEPRCPTWMGDRGLEWLYRLLVNPRHMSRRYLVGNPQFVWNVVRSSYRNKPR
ncbi:MAG: WecB/TagA/CpsF family glycosyltransferase [Planctomycetales bacterium]|nr:WecB/TagA/CpsF family glycosyltransferase [Planctomycetales bacterium]